MKIQYEFNEIEALLKLANMKNLNTIGNFKTAKKNSYRFRSSWKHVHKKRTGYSYLEYTILAKKGEDIIAVYKDVLTSYSYNTKNRCEKIEVSNSDAIETRLEKQNDRYFFDELVNNHKKPYVETVSLSLHLQKYIDTLQKTYLESAIEHLLEYGYTLSVCQPLHQKELYLYAKEKLLGLYDFLILP